MLARRIPKPCGQASVVCRMDCRVKPGNDEVNNTTPSPLSDPLGYGNHRDIKQNESLARFRQSKLNTIF
jgi:hypothetical protein